MESKKENKIIFTKKSNNEVNTAVKLLEVYELILAELNITKD